MIGELDARDRGQETVLLVEDEPMVLDLAVMTLEDAGYVVLPAPGPLEALELAAGYDREIHLLLTDVMMPELNGLQLAARLRATRPGLQCLFMSGYTAELIGEGETVTGVVHVLQKPFMRRELAARVRDVLDTRC